MGEDDYARILADHHAIVRSALSAHDGREVGTAGDGFFAVFDSSTACVAATIEMQRALAAYASPGGEPLRVRMGVYSGEAAEVATGFVGLDVHRAARMAAVGHGGQILLSETAAMLERDSLPDGCQLVDLGFHRLKDLGRPEHIFQLSADGLPSRFPPLRSLDNPALPNNLPAQLSTFVGRRREVAEVRALVGSSRLVTITGAGGAGKTRLALQAAAELLEGAGDGVWLVELASLSDEEEVGAAVADALRIPIRRGEPVLDTLAEALEPQRTLVILDNCEHLIGGCAKVADTLVRRCPKLHLLATSREPLGISGETIYRVPSLSLAEDEGGPAGGGAGGPAGGGAGGAEKSDAVALLVERARAQGVELSFDADNRRLIASVCRRLDGMPLAIELAAARLRSMSLQGLSDRLDQRFRLLTGGSRSALERQQTLQATVDWSYSLLNPTERSVMRRLCVLTDTFDLDAAEAVCGFGDIEGFEVTDLLGSLVDKSLVVAEPVHGSLRYRLLETIRQFAAERLAEGGTEEAASARRAHCMHFLSVAEGAAGHLTGASQGAWYRRLDADQTNLRAAMDFAEGEPDRAFLILRFAKALARYWAARSQAQEPLRLVVPVLDLPDAGDHPELLGSALVVAAAGLRPIHIQRARRLAERAVEISRSVDDRATLATALSILCANYYFVGQPGAGIGFGEEGVDLARSIGDDPVLSQALTCLLLCVDVVDPTRSGPLFEEALESIERSGDRLFGHPLFNNAGVRDLRVGDLTNARAHLEAAMSAARDIDLESHHMLVNLGWVDRESGDRDGARSHFEEGLRICRRQGRSDGLGYSILGLACLASDADDWSRAPLLHGVAQAFLDKTGEAWQTPEDRYREASIARSRSELGEEGFQRRYERGTRLSFDDAISLASGGALLER